MIKWHDSAKQRLFVHENVARMNTFPSKQNYNFSPVTFFFHLYFFVSDWNEINIGLRKRYAYKWNKIFKKRQLIAFCQWG